MRRRDLSGLLLALTVLGPGPGGHAGPAWSATTTAPGGPAPVKRPAAIEWREWSKEAFDEARSKRKLVLLDLTAFWCHWCRVMDQESYSDSAVVAEVAANFVPIRVDHDLRPDIGDRYLSTGWPTTGVLSADGHVLLAKTYLPPGPLRDFLRDAVRFYRTNRQQVDGKVAEAERAVARTWEPDALLPPSISEEEYIEQTIEGLRASEDKAHGGFGAAPKTARWDAISFLLRASDARRDDGLRALAVRAAAAALALQDSVDGGFFRFALAPDWTKTRYERLLDEQASALSVLARVYRATGEERFKKAAQRVHDFVGLELSGQQGAGTGPLARETWRLAIGPDLRRHDGSWMDGEVYFRLSGATRLKQGTLPVSPACVSDASARMLSAITAWRWRAGARDGMSGAMLRGILKAMERDDGSLFHAEQGSARTGEGLLSDQAATGNALLDAFVDSGDPFWLERSDTLAAWMRAHLEDLEGGGFRYAPRDSTAIGRLKAGDKPERANVEAGTFFLRRYWLNGRQEDRAVAERVARYLRSGDKIVLDPARAELVLRLRQEPVRLLVIEEGGRTEPGGGIAHELRIAARNAPVPEVVVRYLDAPPKQSGLIAWPDGPPPDAVAPAIYRWTATGWRGPVTDPAKLNEILDKPAIEP